MPKIHASRSQQIDVPAEKLFAIVRDFRQWRAWSPWLIAEPDCEVTYSEDGKSYAWDGKIIGSGNMAVTGEQPGRSIDHKLTFLKPFKSQAEVRWDFKQKGSGTEVTWTMDSSLPFFMFFFRGMMEAYIGMDYQRGLAMLKEYAEDGAVSVRLEFPGKQRFGGCSYVGLRRKIPIEEISTAMGADLERVDQFVAEAKLERDGKPLSIYHKWDPVKKVTDYTIAIPVEVPPVGLPDDLTSGSVPACEVYLVKHTGPYHHLSNAWSSGMMHARNKVFKQSRAIPPFEIYESDPGEVDEKDLVTVVHLPAK